VVEVVILRSLILLTNDALICQGPSIYLNTCLKLPGVMFTPQLPRHPGSPGIVGANSFRLLRMKVSVLACRRLISLGLSLSSCNVPSVAYLISHRPDLSGLPSCKYLMH